MSTWEKTAGSLLAALGVFVAVHSFTVLRLGLAIAPDAGFVPFLLGIALVVLSVIWVVSCGTGAGACAEPGAFVTKGSRLKLTLVVLAIIAYAWLLERIGYVPSTLAFMAAWQLFVEREVWWKSIVVAGISTAAMYTLFQLLLRVRLPIGAWFA